MIVWYKLGNYPLPREDFIFSRQRLQSWALRLLAVLLLIFWAVFIIQCCIVSWSDRPPGFDELRICLILSTINVLKSCRSVIFVDKSHKSCSSHAQSDTVVTQTQQGTTWQVGWKEIGSISVNYTIFAVHLVIKVWRGSNVGPEPYCHQKTLKSNEAHIVERMRNIWRGAAKMHVWLFGGLETMGI